MNSHRVVQCNIRDVRARKRAEQQVRFAARFAQATIDALSAHLCVIDADGTILAANRAWHEFAEANWPLPTNAAEGAGYLAVCDAVTGPDTAEAAAFAAGLRAVIRGEQAEFSMEYACHSPDEQRWFLGRVSRFVGETPVRVVVAHENITARVQAEQERATMEVQMRQQQKLEAIGTLASGVAHEINNPINGVMNYAQLILDDLPEASPAAEFAREILIETDRVATIVRNLLQFARHDYQGASQARMVDVVAATFALADTILRHDQIALTSDVPADLPRITCRSQQIQQVLMNLLTNARDALNTRYPKHDPDKLIAVTCRPFEDGGRTWLRLTVEDHGGGIPDEVAARVMDPFFTTKPRDQGTGLGLSISHGIVEHHGGRLWFETEPGCWTRFHVDLPADNGGEP